MKLTEDRLKQMIQEEFNNLKEIGEPAPTSEPAEKAKPEDASGKEKTNSVSKLKAELLQVSKELQNVKGLDIAEITTISGLLGVMLKLASSGSSATVLQRVYNVLQKQAK